MDRITLTLVTREHGYLDFDVAGLPRVHRVCVPRALKRGDIFNVYCSDSHKFGATWTGDLKRSLALFAESHSGYAALLSGEG